MSACFQSWFGCVYCRISTGGDQLCQNTPSAFGNVTSPAVQPWNLPVSSAAMMAFGSVPLACSTACAMIATSPKPFSDA